MHTFIIFFNGVRLFSISVLLTTNRTGTHSHHIECIDEKMCFDERLSDFDTHTHRQSMALPCTVHSQLQHPFTLPSAYSITREACVLTACGGHRANSAGPILSYAQYACISGKATHQICTMHTLHYLNGLCGMKGITGTGIEKKECIL